MEKLLKDYRIKQVALAPGLALSSDTTLRKTLDLMKAEKTGCVVTLSGNSLTGIFTERDLINRVMGKNVDWDAPIDNFTTKNPKTLEEDDFLREALSMMKTEKIRHIPVFDSGKNLKGVLSVRNIIKLFAEHFPAEVMNLPPKLHKHLKTPEGG